MKNRFHLKYYPAEVPHTYDYPNHNLAKFLIDSAASYPDITALYFMGKKMSYKQLLEASHRFANGLQSLGIKKGDRVAIMLPNCPQGVIAYYGTLMFGAIVVMTNPLYMPREIEHQLKDSGARVIVTLDYMVSRVEQAMHKKPMEYIIGTSLNDYLAFPLKQLFPLKAKKAGMYVKLKYSAGLLSFVQLLKQSSPQSAYLELDGKNELALIQYTGGTTGVAKGVMLTHYNLIANATQAALWIYKANEPKKKYLAALPFFHVFGLTVLLNLAIRNAGSLYLVPRYKVDEVLKLITKHKLALFPGAPTMYVAIINYVELNKYDVTSIEVCISGAAPLPVEVQERFENLTGGKLIEGYGLTEASPVTHANTVWEKRKIGSIGIPFPDTEARIVDPLTGETLPLGEVGELVVRGPQVMKGYWQNEAETNKAIKDGWLYTGDLGKMDEDGFCYILDRRKDIIIAGGFNIYPREVEEVLYEHPAVEEAVVAGIVDPYRGETVKAYVVLKDNATASSDELKQFCKERLAAYKVPKVYEFRDALPKTLVGKILRRKLIEEEMQRSSKDQEKHSS